MDANEISMEEMARKPANPGAGIRQRGQRQAKLAGREQTSSVTVRLCDGQHLADNKTIKRKVNMASQKS